jgi:(1->4)-alpha-D-glucan 1-alpha-D-glucosylmutase
VPSARHATYRLQLHPGFGFREAAEVVPYLRDLGISHVYCSPVFAAASGSMHGYDVVDPGSISEQLGGEAGFAVFCATLDTLSLGVLLDIVPNHMCVTDRGNWRWWDVLEDGRQSPWAETFDIDWAASDRVLVPVLGGPLEQVAQRGELRVALEAGRLVVRYQEHSAPLTLPAIAEAFQDPAAPEPGPGLAELAREIAGLEEADDEPSRRRRCGQRMALHARLAAAIGPDSEPLLRAIAPDAAALLKLLSRQHYELAFWREAATRINYRRFFDISSLAGVRVEDATVFDDTQALALELVHSRAVDGLRVDHVDGLLEPAAYLQRLRAGVGEGWWLVVEKILGADEALPEEWPVAGTTGYEFAAVAGGLFVDPAGRVTLEGLAGRMGAPRVEARTVLEDAKRQVCEETFPAEVSRLARLLRGACAAQEEAFACGESECAAAISALLVAMPVYRTYVTPSGVLSESDRGVLQAAIRRARAATSLPPKLWEPLARIAAGETRNESDIELALRLQQTSAAVTAKGVEDTAFYRLVGLTSLDEVGDSPLHWGTGVDAFHRHNVRTSSAAPQGLLATSTHDSKRSEDVRMRLHVLSEFPDRWAERVLAWSSANARHKPDGDPDGCDELLLYQTLVGAHPLSGERALGYMLKATREAKRRTSWSDPNPAYEDAVERFTRSLVTDTGFMASLVEFVAPLVTLGRVNSLALTLLKLTSPGVPDIYQGCELWDLTLVDPDNRRDVDYAERKRLLSRARDEEAADGWMDDSGAAKLELVRRALAVRRRRSASFGAGGGYRPLPAHGDRQDHVVCLQRGSDVIAAVPRLVGALNGWSAAYRPRWGETRVELPPGRWRDVLSLREHTGAVDVGELLGAFPVALLERAGE